MDGLEEGGQARLRGDSESPPLQEYSRLWVIGLTYKGRAYVWYHKAFARFPKNLRRKRKSGGWVTFCVSLNSLKCFKAFFLINEKVLKKHFHFFDERLLFEISENHSELTSHPFKRWPHLGISHLVLLQQERACKRAVLRTPPAHRDEIIIF